MKPIDAAYLELWGISPLSGDIPNALVKSRLFDNPELDSCLLGTALNEWANRVLVYNELSLLEHFHAQGSDAQGENPVFDEVGAPYFYHRVEKFLEQRGEWAPLVFRVGSANDNF